MDTENGSNAPVKVEPAPIESAMGSEKASTTPNKNNPKKKGFPWVKVILIIIAAILLYDIAKKVHTDRAKQEPIKERIHPVKTEFVKKLRGVFEVQYAGSTRAIKQVDIGFNVDGTLNELPIKAGMMLKLNDVIGALDPRDYQNDLNAANADYINAKARLDRVQKLYDAAVDPKSKLDEALALFKVSEAKLEIAQKARNDTVLKAPFKGIVAIRYVDNFQVVGKGQPIISLQDLNTLEIQADIPEWLVSRATEAEDIEIFATYDVLPGVKIPLKIKEFFAQAAKSTRTYTVRFFMETNPTSDKVTILPGMTANVTMLIKPESGNVPEFILPIWAVNTVGGKSKASVFVVDDKQSPWTVHEKQVEVGQMTDDSIVIKGTLSDGDRVVIAGATMLQDGMKVKDLPLDLKSNFAEKQEKKMSGTKGSVSTEYMMPEETK